LVICHAQLQILVTEYLWYFAREQRQIFLMLLTGMPIQPHKNLLRNRRIKILKAKRVLKELIAELKLCI